MPLKKILFPHVFQNIGWIMSLCGIIMVYLRFGLGIKPDFLEINVFAVYSKYFDTKYFSMIQNNISEEIGGVILLVGLFFLAFSKEKNEKEHYWKFRLNALMLAAYGYSAFLLFSLLFIYGIAFVSVMNIYILLPLVLYIILFRYQVFRDKKITTS